MNKQQTKQVIDLVNEATFLGKTHLSKDDIIKCIEIAYQEGLRDGEVKAYRNTVKQLEDFWDKY
jgi:uncharacterized Fe-S cluster-containing protein